MECELPAGHTARALKKALPERSVVSKDARVTVNAAASMFALYLSSIAHDNAAANKRQTVVLRDVLQALRDADFEHFIAPVETCLRETKAAAALKKSKKSGAEKADALDADGAAALDDDIDDDIDDDDDEEMQSAADGATEEEEDDNEGDGEQDAENEAKDDALDQDMSEAAVDDNDDNDDNDDKAVAGQ
ncbi:hypothetical protein PybrP1_010510 [[Pythium] brassicae (nom. inval.)]|nr:hypothetical protein PybrP1_010510 [[Pythium] brassicae (nom. inval.)]